MAPPLDDPLPFFGFTSLLRLARETFAPIWFLVFVASVLIMKEPLLYVNYRLDPGFDATCRTTFFYAVELTYAVDVTPVKVAMTVSWPVLFV